MAEKLTANELVELTRNPEKLFTIQDIFGIRRTGQLDTTTLAELNTSTDLSASVVRAVKENNYDALVRLQAAYAANAGESGFSDAKSGLIDPGAKGGIPTDVPEQPFIPTQPDQPFTVADTTGAGATYGNLGGRDTAEGRINYETTNDAQDSLFKLNAQYGSTDQGLTVLRGIDTPPGVPDAQGAFLGGNGEDQYNIRSAFQRPIDGNTSAVISGQAIKGDYLTGDADDNFVLGGTIHQQLNETTRGNYGLALSSESGLGATGGIAHEVKDDNKAFNAAAQATVYGNGDHTVSAQAQAAHLLRDDGQGGYLWGTAKAGAYSQRSGDLSQNGADVTFGITKTKTDEQGRVYDAWGTHIRGAYHNQEGSGRSGGPQQVTASMLEAGVYKTFGEDHDYTAFANARTINMDRDGQNITSNQAEVGIKKDNMFQIWNQQVDGMVKVGVDRTAGRTGVIAGVGLSIGGGGDYAPSGPSVSEVIAKNTEKAAIARFNGDDDAAARYTALAREAQNSQMATMEQLEARRNGGRAAEQQYADNSADDRPRYETRTRASKAIDAAATRDITLNEKGVEFLKTAPDALTTNEATQKFDFDAYAGNDRTKWKALQSATVGLTGVDVGVIDGIPGKPGAETKTRAGLTVLEQYAKDNGTTVPDALATYAAERGVEKSVVAPSLGIKDGQVAEISSGPQITVSQSRANNEFIRTLNTEGGKQVDFSTPEALETSLRTPATVTVDGTTVTLDTVAQKKAIQETLQLSGAYNGKIDGDFGSPERISQSRIGIGYVATAAQLDGVTVSDKLTSVANDYKTQVLDRGISEVKVNSNITVNTKNGDITVYQNGEVPPQLVGKNLYRGDLDQQQENPLLQPNNDPQVLPDNPEEFRGRLTDKPEDIARETVKTIPPHEYTIDRGPSTPPFYPDTPTGNQLDTPVVIEETPVIKSRDIVLGKLKTPDTPVIIGDPKQPPKEPPVVDPEDPDEQNPDEPGPGGPGAPGRSTGSVSPTQIRANQNGKPANINFDDIDPAKGVDAKALAQLQSGKDQGHAV